MPVIQNLAAALTPLCSTQCAAATRLGITAVDNQKSTNVTKLSERKKKQF